MSLPHPTCLNVLQLPAGDVISALAQRKASVTGSGNTSFFITKIHPETMGESEVVLFLNHLAVDRKVAASTQSQALNALVFLYANVLEKTLPPMVGLKRVHHRHRVPVVLTQDEVRAILNQMQGTPRLMAQVLYGAGLRVAECVSLRVKDLDFGSKAISVRSGKGSKDRITIIFGQP